MKVKQVFYPALIFGAIFVGNAAVVPAQADEGKPKIGSLDSPQIVSSTLQELIGKEATVHLKSGQSVAGKVKAVGKTAVHIAELRGKEFYDAVVLLDSISAVELRAK